MNILARNTCESKLKRRACQTNVSCILDDNKCALVLHVLISDKLRQGKTMSISASHIVSANKTAEGNHLGKHL